MLNLLVGVKRLIPLGGDMCTGISVYYFVITDIYEEELHRKTTKKYSWRQHLIQWSQEGILEAS